MGYTLTVPEEIHVPTGFCIHVPCSFTVPSTYSASSEPFYGYWFKVLDEKTYLLWINLWVMGQLVCTNDRRQNIRNPHFRMTGRPEKGDCSFSIIQPTLKHIGLYYFRVDKGDHYRYNFYAPINRIHTVPVLIVTDILKPEIKVPSKIVWGKPVTLSCFVPNNCHGKVPQVTWLNEDASYVEYSWQAQQGQWSWMFGSNLTFTPSLSNRENLFSCHVNYSQHKTTRTTSVQLNIGYTPDLFHREKNKYRCRHEIKTFVCQCSFHGWPPPQIHWEVNGALFTQNRRYQNLEIISSTDDIVVTSFLKFRITPANITSIICIATNPFGERKMKVIETSTTDTAARKAAIPGTILGMSFMFLFALIASWGVIYMIVRYQARSDTENPPTNEESPI